MNFLLLSTTAAAGDTGTGMFSNFTFIGVTLLMVAVLYFVDRKSVV